LFDDNLIAVKSSRWTKRVPQIFAVLLQTSQTIAAAVLLVGMSLAKQTSQEPAQPTLHVQTDLVVVPFQVRRGSRSVSGLKPSDVVLLEDGVPRAFTGFEAPSDHLSLELVMMFDVTDVERGGFWSAKALHDLTSYWNEAIARALLEEPGATIQISVYQFDQYRLRRLCRSTDDPKELLTALDRLNDPIPAGQGFDLQLPRGTVVRVEDQVEKRDVIPWSRSLLGAITVLGDSAGSTTMVPRALVIFSPGAEGTSITPQDLADQGVAANVPIYPVVLPTDQAIWYEGYPFDPEGPLGWGLHCGLGHCGPGRFSQWGMCIDPELRGKRVPVPLPDTSLIDCPLNVPFEDVGKQTGGRSFEPARRAPPKIPRSGEARPLDRFSMAGGQVNDILEAVKRHALARFTSTYTVWFAPSPSTSPRNHKLEVRLATKSSAKVTDGKRSAAY
jgi:hypothetical protein